MTSLRISLRRLLLALPLMPLGATLAGGAVGPGPITLPPIVAKFDERCLDRIDKNNEALAARQSRECRKPRGSRNALPVAGRAQEPVPQPQAQPQSP